MAMASMEMEHDLPGFRFHPTEEELLGFYLHSVVHGKKLHFDIIGTLNIYGHDPWDLPAMAKIGEREWYFFVPRDRKAGSGGRPNRTTEHGFWKATGSDRAIRSSTDAKRVIGLKKTLVFYKGRAPRGTKTDWVMNEYRLPEFGFATGRVAPAPTNKEEMVLCKIYRKATPLKELEQRACELEERQRRNNNLDYMARASLVQVSAGDDYLSLDDGFLVTSSSSSTPSEDSNNEPMGPKKEDDATVTVAEAAALPPPQQMTATPPVLNMPSMPQLPMVRHADLPSLQVPANHGVFDWMQDPFQLRSPWQDQLFLSPLTNLLY